jgi:hypothetical protein
MLDAMPHIYNSELNSIYFTITNHGYIHFVHNFCERLKRLNSKLLDYFLIICTDKESYVELQKIHANCFYYDKKKVSKGFEEWKTTSYKDIVFNKLVITQAVLEFAQKVNCKHVIYTDTDMWWCKDFTVDLHKYIESVDHCVDILMQDGEDYFETNNEPEYKLENTHLIVNRACYRFCTGFMVLKPTKEVIDLFDFKKNKKVNYENYVGNQPFLNEALKHVNLNVITIPRNLLLNGSGLAHDTYFHVVHTDVEPWCIHYNYLIGAHKIDTMIQHDHWLLDHVNNKTFNVIKTNKPVVYVKCPDGFANQLRLMLAGCYLMHENIISDFIFESVINNHNNVDFLHYFEPLPFVTYEKIINIEKSKIIDTASFTGLLQRFARGVEWQTALTSVFKFLKPKKEIKQKVKQFILDNNINNACGVHARRTCKVAILKQSLERHSLLKNHELLTLCQDFDKVFLATDNKETQEWFSSRLPSQICTYKGIYNGKELFTEDVYNRASVERFTDAEHTVMDFLILKNCKTFVGTNESAFSLLIHHWRQNPEDFLIFGKL